MIFTGFSNLWLTTANNGIDWIEFYHPCSALRNSNKAQVGLTHLITFNVIMREKVEKGFDGGRGSLSFSFP